MDFSALELIDMRCRTTMSSPQTPIMTIERKSSLQTMQYASSEEDLFEIQFDGEVVRPHRFNSLQTPTRDKIKNKTIAISLHNPNRTKLNEMPHIFAIIDRNLFSHQIIGIIADPIIKYQPCTEAVQNTSGTNRLRMDPDSNYTADHPYTQAQDETDDTQPGSLMHEIFLKILIFPMLSRLEIIALSHRLIRYDHHSDIRQRCLFIE